MACLTDLFSEYKETMREINKALETSKEVEKYLEKCKSDISASNKKNIILKNMII
jgi:hypothetical protein